MRYNVEHQRNIAFDLLWLNRKGIKLDKVIDADAIIIHGYDFIGKELYHTLKEYTNVLCIIDRAHDNEIYENIKVYSMANPELYEISRAYKNIKVIVTVLSDKENIFDCVNKNFFNAKPISIYKIITNAKLQEKSFKDSFNNRTWDLVDNIMEEKFISIPNIVLAGTAYTTLLTILYLDNWRDSLFILERFVSSKIVENMKEKGIRCIYEKNAVECHSLTYILSEYAQKYQIPIWGHDHLPLSKAFLVNKINVVEDGIGNYKCETPYRFPVFLDNGRRYLPFGYDDDIEHIVLTEMFEIPEELKGKTEVVNPKVLWERKSEEEKRMITDIFCFPYKEGFFNEEKIIFLTEPNISVGEVILTEEEQIQIYETILANYPEQQIVIKPHPADCINYKKYFPKYMVIDKDFPIQMIEWCEIKVKKYIVMSGSSCERLFKHKYAVDVYEGITLL